MEAWNKEKELESYGRFLLVGPFLARQFLMWEQKENNVIPGVKD